MNNGFNLCHEVDLVYTMPCPESLLIKLTISLSQGVEGQRGCSSIVQTGIQVNAGALFDPSQ